MEITTTTTMMHSEIRMDQNTTTTTSNLRTKPPLPPKQPPMPHTIAADVTVPAKSEPTKTKGNHIQNRIDDENNAHQKTQRLIAMNDKLNLELAAVRKSLQHERAGVRELRWGKEKRMKEEKNCFLFMLRSRVFIFMALFYCWSSIGPEMMCSCSSKARTMSQTIRIYDFVCSRDRRWKVKFMGFRCCFEYVYSFIL